MITETKKTCKHDYTEGVETHKLCPKCGRSIGTKEFVEVIRADTAKEIFAEFDNQFAHNTKHKLSMTIVRYAIIKSKFEVA